MVSKISLFFQFILSIKFLQRQQAGPRHDNILSPKMWKKIFGYIDDPAILINLQHVCEEWHNIIDDKFTNDKIIWKEACHKYIPYFWIKSEFIIPMSTPILNAMHEITLKEENYKIWKRIYLSWHEFHREILIPETAIRTNGILIISETERISCMDVVGN